MGTRSGWPAGREASSPSPWRSHWSTPLALPALVLSRSVLTGGLRVRAAVAGTGSERGDAGRQSGAVQESAPIEFQVLAHGLLLVCATLPSIWATAAHRRFPGQGGYVKTYQVTKGCTRTRPGGCGAPPSESRLHASRPTRTAVRAAVRAARARLDPWTPRRLPRGSGVDSVPARKSDEGRGLGSQTGLRRREIARAGVRRSDDSDRIGPRR